MPTTRKIISIAHFYVVALNRRLVNEIARLGQEEWEVTAVAPTTPFHREGSNVILPKVVKNS